jgi:hypothetical protein
MRARVTLELDVELLDGIEPLEGVRMMFRYHADQPVHTLLGALRIMDVRLVEPWELAGEGEQPYGGSA